MLAYDGPDHRAHMSNIWKREPFRHHLYISKAATGVIVGLARNGVVVHGIFGFRAYATDLSPSIHVAT
ncbi:type II 3-dehydroquinate dehydratase [Brucella endophytica]|nr:type II 3-dehydroquinate dehydratase [Brucella endophytica]